MRGRSIILVFLALFLILPQTVEAKKHKHLHGIFVSSVDAHTSQIVLLDETNKQPLSYHVSPGATITMNGLPWSLNKIHVGMQVVAYIEADEHVLSRIDLQNAKAK